ncbi:kelch-like protein 24 [Acanthaster planci]|uniref:Kelch-like protein 24 n=1 Tax=Acanthaster planci TaxID=133434 RepID=A0A8B7YDP0_ACAPL|nr:kelch-like protein 24 [Acanthaster planci]
MASSRPTVSSIEDIAWKQEQRDFCNFENYALPGTVLASFNELRHGNDLIDVVLTVGEKEIPCHRVVLAASSPYFKAMFTRNVEERGQRKVTLQDVNPNMLQMIVDYIYTSQVRITTENVQELLSTSNFFLIKCLVYACSNFLIRQLDVDNCIEMHSFAESQGCEELSRAACGYVVREFPQVCKTEAFLNASPQLLSQYAAHENLNVRSEAELLRALLEWLTHGEKREAKQRSFLSVVRHVRLPFVGQECLEELSKMPLCHFLVSNSVNYCCEPPLQLHKWNKLAPIPYTIRNVVMYDVVRFKNDVYLTGGFDGEMQPGAVTYVWAYRTEMDTWEEQERLNVARYQHCSAVLGGHIYIIGGYDGKTKLTSVETYDSGSNTWTCIQPMTIPVAFATAAAWNGRLFVIGGMTQDDRVFSGIQCYDLEHQTWTVISTLQVNRKGCKCVLLNDLIYLFGGVTREVQVYDPACDKAFNVASMISTHMCTGATVLNGKIYVAGGDNLENTVNNKWDSVECYDPVTDEWQMVGTMPLSLYMHGLVTVIRNCLTIRTPPNEMLQPIGPSMLYRGYGEGRVDYDLSCR